MANTLLIVVLVLMAATLEAHFAIQGSSYTPSSELDYVHLLKSMVGVNSASDEISPQLQEYLSKEGYSLIHNIERLNLVFTAGDNAGRSNLIKIEGDHLSELVAQHPQSFLLQLQGEGKKAQKPSSSQHVLIGSKAEMDQLLARVETARMLQAKIQPIKQVNPPLSRSYILKFFFSVVFAAVTLGALGLIINMNNRKDTLLYAKFIADVGK